MSDLEDLEHDEASTKLCFVLLQYRNLDQTLSCVRSLLNLAEAVEIVVVDNFSSQELVTATRDSLEGTPRVHLVFRDENDGYARGNNAGYRYAREHLGARFIAVFNNDTEVLQRDFCRRVRSVFRRTQFSVLGPDVRVQDGRRVLHQNPSLRSLSADDVRQRLARLQGPIQAKPSKIPGRYSRAWFPRRDLVLHGAALVFSPRFVSDFDEPFDPRTFLYEEERILYYRARARGHQFWYHPTVVVWHRTQVKDYKTSSDYQAWRQSVKAESYKTLLSVLEEASSFSLHPSSEGTSGSGSAPGSPSPRGQ